MSEYEWTTAEYMTYKIWQKNYNDKLYLLRVYAPDANVNVDEFLDQYQLLVTKSGKIAKNDFYGGWGDPSWAFNTQTMVEELLANNGRLFNQKGFTLINKYSLPDGTTGYLWGKATSLLTL